MYTPACLLTALGDFLTFSLLSADNPLPPHIQGLEGAEAQIGRIMACYHAAALLCQAVAGAYLDRWPRKPVLLATTATLTAVAFAFAAGGAALALGSLAFWRSFREAERGRGSEAA